MKITRKNICDSMSFKWVMRCSACFLVAFCFIFKTFTAGTAGGVAGDINESGRVDGYDLWIFSQARATEAGDPEFNADADLCPSGKHAQGKFFSTARHEESTISLDYEAPSPGNENPFKTGKLICHSLEIIEGCPVEERQMKET